MSTITRLLTGVSITSGGCMLWQGADSGNGYGRISVGGKTRATHIVAYELFVGPVPRGMVLDHTCRNRLCFNPKCLVPRTNLENVLMGKGPTAVNARKEFCLRGHKLEGKNLITRVRGGRTHRECRECRKGRR